MEQALQNEDRQLFFEQEDIDFELPNDEQRYIDWIQYIIKKEKKELLQLTYIFCSDSYLHQINVEYLNHDTLTDIITFPYTEPPLIEGDIFISIDRVKENAVKYGVSFEDELHRVIIHGVLHLCGYPDKTEEEAKVMRKKEEEALEIWDEIIPS
ncbi:MAG: rRNA maturation RNase YbeY [Chitinophagales bacterium]|nr:rRNA maturation RNase YbeY [Chitinophagales bacterium]